MSSGFYYMHWAADPYFNMAFDEWLLSQALDQQASVYLRLYTWQIGTITFGYNQNERTALDFSRLNQTPVIRRVTGGRAVYHDVSELTYAIAVNSEGLDNERLSGSPSHISVSVASALKGFLDRLGVISRYVRSSTSEKVRRDFFHKAPCFASHARYELVSEGRKVVASAQKRVGSVLLQHGSIKLAGVAGHPALEGLSESVMSGLQPVGRKEFSATAAVYCEAMADSLGLSFTASDLSKAQTKRLEMLRECVKKNALRRRHIIERFTCHDSL